MAGISPAMTGSTPPTASFLLLDQTEILLARSLGGGCQTPPRRNQPERSTVHGCLDALRRSVKQSHSERLLNLSYRF